MLTEAPCDRSRTDGGSKRASRGTYCLFSISRAKKEESERHRRDGFFVEHEEEITRFQLLHLLAIVKREKPLGPYLLGRRGLLLGLAREGDVAVEWELNVEKQQGARFSKVEPELSSSSPGGGAILSLVFRRRRRTRFHARKAPGALHFVRPKWRLAGQRRRVPPASDPEAREERHLRVREGRGQGADCANEARPPPPFLIFRATQATDSTLFFSRSLSLHHSSTRT